MRPSTAPDRTGWLAWDHYLRCIRADTARLAEVAEGRLDRPVPSCPGWTVDTLLRHVAMVYLHKVECVRNAAPPKPWPPPGADQGDPVDLLRRAGDELLAVLEVTDPDSVGYTWWEPDQTNGFWYRRMAHEAAVHRIDGELAVGDPTPVDEALAVDGVDELLRIMLGGPWWDDEGDTVHPVDAAVRVTTSGRSWTVRLDRQRVEVREEADSDVQAEVAGDPGHVYLWLWRRAPSEPLLITGDDQVVDEFWARIAESNV